MVETPNPPASPGHAPLLRTGAVHEQGPDTAVPSHYGAPLREQRRLLAGRAVVDLGQLEILAVSGADARSWLTTVSSQAFTDAAVGDSRSVSVLSPKGRLEHLAAAVITAEDEVVLVTDPGRRDGLRGYLEMMRFAARVQFEDRDDLRVLGSTTPAPQVLAGHHVELPEPAWTWEDPWPAVTPGGVSYGPDPDDPTAWFLTAFDADALASIPWTPEMLAGTQSSEALRIANHEPRLATEADDRTIPHELDLLRTAVHTTKGCYRGQETVAKVLNLGQPPRRLVMLHLDGSQDVPAAAGGAVHLETPEGKNIGVVTSAALHADLGPIALAVIKRAAPLDAPLVVRVQLTDEAGGGQEMWLDAAQEPIVVTREHGQRPSTARL